MKCSCGEKVEPSRHEEATSAGPETLVWRCRACWTEWKMQIIYTSSQIQTAWVHSLTATPTQISGDPRVISIV